MNKKKINIFLIPGALLIWALILIKIFSFTKNPEAKIYNLPILFTPHDSISVTDTITINAKYRDPFSPSKIKIASIINANESTIKPVQQNVKTIIFWPKITYRGLIKNARDGKEYVLLTISDLAIVSRVNCEIAGVKILASYSDSLIIQFKKETKAISKN